MDVRTEGLQRVVLRQSPEVARLRRQPPQHWRQILQLPRNQVFHVTLALPGPVHEHQPSPQELFPLGIAKRFPADDLNHSGLILERDEHGAVRGLRLLPQRHDAGIVHEPPGLDEI
jgi:hypothetical protein